MEGGARSVATFVGSESGGSFGGLCKGFVEGAVAVGEGEALSIVYSLTWVQGSAPERPPWYS